jgi:hypothetical protein
MSVVNLMKNGLKRDKSEKSEIWKKKIQQEATIDPIFTLLDRRHNPINGCGSRYEHTQYERGCTASCRGPTFFVSKP